MSATPAENKPAYFKGFLWFAFSAASMLSAVTLPIHIFLFLTPGSVEMRLDHPIFRIYFFILFISALYHGLYRTKTILFDLGLGKYEKIIGTVTTIIFLLFAALTIKLLFL